MFHPSSWVYNSPSVLVMASSVPLPSLGQPTASLLYLLLLSAMMTSSWGGETEHSSSLSASFSFLIDTMTSSLPWKFHLPSCAPPSASVLRVPIKKGSQLSISAEHSRVLKLLGSVVSALGKLLLRQDHEALRDCLLPPRAGGCLLFSSSVSTK